MKGFACVAVAICLLSLSAAQTTCPADGNWGTTTMDTVARRECKDYSSAFSRKIGFVTRKCMNSGSGATWGVPNEEGCRDRFPTDDKIAYVDIDYTLTQSRPDRIVANTKFNEYWVQAHGPNFDVNLVTVYEKSRISSSACIVSIRVQTTRGRGTELSNKLADAKVDDALFAVIASAKFNQENQFWPDHTKASLNHVATYNQSEPKNLMPVVIGVIVGFILLLLIAFFGFYFYIQMKRRSTKGGSTQLKSGAAV